ncbi:hypothetical protein [Ferruginibacter sp. HRS2-29]|uniref:hypothetical protein n=1 Tax=Ferruginibacter sp. HRS2-29 TaxID=2487334 RepID=UPI0020CDE9A3|nr:hypothetical protein [Ferruginibacter sp. HRS2-29]MCP9752746.1 hypothetical protein [Ferruginibacter sp. HRS2-29]
MNKIIYCLLVISFLTNCTNIEKKYFNQSQKIEINCSPKVLSFLDHFCQTEIADSITRIYYIKYDTLYISDNLSDSIIAISLDKTNDYTHYQLQKNKLLLLDGENVRVDIYEIDFLKNKSEFLRTVELAGLYNAKNSALLYAQANALFFRDTILYLKFGKFYEPANFTGKKVFYKINIFSSHPQLIDSFFQYPSSITEKEVREKTTFLGASKNDSLFYCGFASSDEIQLMNMHSGKMIRKKYAQYANFKKYDDDKRTDLGYIRYYDLTNERNIYETFYKGKFIIIKKLKTEKLNQSPAYDLYILDENLRLLSLTSLNFQPGKNIFPYKSGIVVSDTTGKLNYYEI